MKKIEFLRIGKDTNDEIVTTFFDKIEWQALVERKRNWKEYVWRVYIEFNAQLILFPDRT